MGREVELANKLTLAQLDREVTAHVSHFDRRDAIQAVANLLPNGAPAHEVESAADAFLSSDSVVRVAETAKGLRFTTTRIWALERQALEVAQRMAREARGEAGELAAKRVIGERPTLKDDQREMVYRLLAVREGIVVVIGEAGTGKSFATVAAAEGWAQAGFELRAVAPTWRAANVLRAEGLEATSVASFLRDFDRDEARLSPRTVLLVDEASMVGSEQLARLISHAGKLLGADHPGLVDQKDRARRKLASPRSRCEAPADGRRLKASARRTLAALQVGAGRAARSRLAPSLRLQRRWRSSCRSPPPRSPRRCPRGPRAGGCTISRWSGFSVGRARDHPWRRQLARLASHSPAIRSAASSASRSSSQIRLVVIADAFGGLGHGDHGLRSEEGSAAASTSSAGRAVGKQLATAWIASRRSKWEAWAVTSRSSCARSAWRRELDLLPIVAAMASRSRPISSALACQRWRRSPSSSPVSLFCGWRAWRPGGRGRSILPGRLEYFRAAGRERLQPLVLEALDLSDALADRLPLDAELKVSSWRRWAS